jgi:hypothetical protein
MDIGQMIRAWRLGNQLHESVKPFHRHLHPSRDEHSARCATLWEGAFQCMQFLAQHSDAW